MALLSVIVPVYNGEKTIEKCINSLLLQSLSDIEIIVVNDGSTDSTEDILKKFSDERIRVITIPNSGQGIARNKGIEISQGKYVGFVDADDTVSNDMYRLMVNAAEENGAQMVQCAINDIKPGSVTKRPDIIDRFIEINNISHYARQYFYSLIHTNEVCNKIYLRSLLTDNNISFDNTFEVYSEDLKLNIDILPFIKRVYFMGKSLYNYNINEEGHCLKNPEARLKGISTLYKRSIEGLKHRDLKNCIKSMAVINLLSYSIPVENHEFSQRLICSGFMKNCMLSSIIYKKTLRHALLMLSLILCPLSLKKKLIKKHYTFS